MKLYAIVDRSTLTQPSESAPGFRHGLAEGSRERRNRVQARLGAPAFHLDNRVLGEAALDGEISKAPAARLAQSLDALAESRLQGTAPRVPSVPILCCEEKSRFHFSDGHKERMSLSVGDLADTVRTLALQKGDLVEIKGELRSSVYEPATGTFVTTWEVRARWVSALDRASNRPKAA